MHKAKIVKKFFKEEELLELWANSADLNPIENLWVIVKQELRKSRETLEKLEDKWSKP